VSDWLRAIILGVVEGLTEFLPVSSTGHMILVQPLIGVSPDLPTWKTFLWVVQFAAILAVIVYFWRDLWRQTFQPEARNWREHLVTKLLVAMVPTVVLALLLHSLAEKYLETPPSVAAALIVGGVAMLYIDRRYRRDGQQRVEDITLTQAFLIGTIQCLSMWSGISRSGATIMGGMVLGLTPRVATLFSFYLAIPTMLAASAKTLWKYRHELTGDGVEIVLVGSVVAFAVALAVVAFFLQFVRTRRFTIFAAYRIALGVIVIAWYVVSRPHSP
jgi:undecaprenyl-diphosphatase